MVKLSPNFSLNQQEGETGHRNYFMIYLHESYIQTPCQLHEHGCENGICDLDVHGGVYNYLRDKPEY